MKTLKSILILSVLVTSVAFGKSKSPDTELKSTVRQQIVNAVEKATIYEKGQVTVKFAVDAKGKLQILQVNGKNARLSSEVKTSLLRSYMMFPKGSEGTYEVKLTVNDAAASSKLDESLVRNSIIESLNTIEAKRAESVEVKFRVLSPSNVMVMHTKGASPELAAKIKSQLENKKYAFPAKVNGEYKIRVSFE